MNSREGCLEIRRRRRNAWQQRSTSRGGAGARPPQPAPRFRVPAGRAGDKPAAGSQCPRQSAGSPGGLPRRRDLPDTDAACSRPGHELANSGSSHDDRGPLVAARPRGRDERNTTPCRVGARLGPPVVAAPAGAAPGRRAASPSRSTASQRAERLPVNVVATASRTARMSRSPPSPCCPAGWPQLQPR